MLKNIIQSFLPWILYFFIKGHTQLSLDIAIIIAFVTSILFEMKSLKKGFVLSWGTLIFFIFLLISVVIFKNQWILNHEWLFSNGTLALIAWISILIRKPFTMQYAKEIVEEEHWNHPLFIKINGILSSVWGCVFLLQLSVHFLKLYSPTINEIIHNIISYGASIIAIWFTIWFPDWYREKYKRGYTHAK